MAAPLKEERQHQILEALQDHRQVTVAELSQRFDISEVTVRRDLRELATRGAVRRAYGGAMAPMAAADEPPVVQRMARAADEKAAIGRAAAELVADGQSVFIGSGSTTVYLAQHLVGRQNLTVVTNALTVASELAAARGVAVVVTGGVLRPSEMSLIGHVAELSLRELRVDKVILGMRAISLEAGMTNDYLPEVMTDRTIIGMALELIVLADHTKLGKVTSAYIAPVDRISTLVTDPGADPEIVARLRDEGVRVILAEE